MFHAPSLVLRPMLAAAFMAGCAIPALAQQPTDAELAAAPKLDVPYVPTPEQVVARMLELAEVDENDFVMDLGSGDGRIAIAAARDHGARALGVDIDPQRIKEANENAEKAGVTDKVEFRQANLFETDFSEADVLTMYLLSRVNLELRPKILEDLEPGTHVVSHAFSMGDWEPDQSDNVDGRNVYLWIVPAKVDGAWTVEHDGQSIPVTVKQEFQKIEGTATVDGKEMPLEEATLRGDMISFKVGDDVFAGQVDGDMIEPATEGAPAGAATGWTAKRS